jgi:hypothetical protein
MAKKEVLDLEVKSNIKSVTKETKQLAEESTKAQKGVQGIGTAFKGIGNAIKTAGIGLILGLLASFLDAFRQNQRVLDFFNTTLKATSIVFNDLFKFLDNNFATIQGYLKGLFTDPIGQLYILGQAIQRYFVDSLGGVIDLIEAVGKLLAEITNPRKFLENMALVSIAAQKASKDISTEFDKLSSSITEYTSGIIDSATAMVELDKAAELAIATNQKILEQKDREAEIQRQIRDDVTKTFAERIEANNQLNTILDDQEKLMLANATIVKEAARVQKELTGNDADRIAFIQAEAEELAILAQIEGFRSEQKTNAISLQEEEKAVAMENAEAQLAAFSGLAGALSSLAGDNKELAAASAIIDTYAGATKAFAQGGVAGFVTGAAIIAAGLANVQKIYATDVGSGGGGGGTVSAQPPAPQMMSGAFELTGGTEPQPIQAYVVSDEITDSQNGLEIIRRRATI